jgi:hypothetical protein
MLLAKVQEKEESRWLSRRMMLNWLNCGFVFYAIFFLSNVYFEEDIYRVNGYDGYASDQIALNRSIKDIRHRGCKDMTHVEKLPSVTVIFPFHDEVSYFIIFFFTFVYKLIESLTFSTFLLFFDQSIRF